MSRFERIAPVSTRTDERCAMWIVSSRLPIHRGVYCTTLVGVICTWVGNRWLPRLQRLARNTSPEANGRPFRQIHTASAARTTIAVNTVHHSQSGSPVTDADVKLFAKKEHLLCRIVRLARPGTPGRTSSRENRSA